LSGLVLPDERTGRPARLASRQSTLDARRSTSGTNWAHFAVAFCSCARQPEKEKEKEQENWPIHFGRCKVIGAAQSSKLIELHSGFFLLLFVAPSRTQSLCHCKVHCKSCLLQWTATVVQLWACSQQLSAQRAQSSVCSCSSSTH